MQPARSSTRPSVSSRHGGWVAVAVLVALSMLGAASAARAQSFTITASSNSGGTITPPGAVPVETGGEQAFTIAADPCYSISDVLVDGVSVGVVTTYTFTNVTADHKIEAVFAPTMFNIFAMDGAGGAMDPSGFVPVACGSDQVFTVTANDCNHLSDVLVDNVSVGAVSTYTFTNVQADHTIETLFTFDTFTITASAGPHGTIAINGPVIVSCGEDQEFAITPAPCYSVADVLVDGVSVGQVTDYMFTNVHAAHTISASFVRDFTIQSSATAGGSISPTPSVPVMCGENQDFTITPEPCHHITDVLVDGESVGAVSSYTFTNVQASHVIAASFAFDTYTIAASTNAGGSIGPSGDVIVSCGTDQPFTIAADGCHTLEDVLVDGVSVGAITSYTFTNVTETHTIAASFLVKPYTIAASAGPLGAISPAGAVGVDCGSSQVFGFTPDACHQVADVLVDGASVGTPVSYTFTNITANHTIAVSFVLSTYTVAASAGAGGTITPSGDASVDCGADRSYTIAANPCYHIADVLVDGVSVGAVGSHTFSNVQANHTIAASFAIDTYTIAATGTAGGTISPTGSVTADCGSDHVFVIAPSACYEIGDVMVDGATVGAVSSYTFTNVQAAHTISASFLLNSYTVAASAGPNGSITPSGSLPVSCGTDLSFAIAAAPCYHVADVLVDGASVGALAAYTFTNLASSHTIAASFAADPYTIAAATGVGGAISPSGDVSVNCGANQAFTITPAACFALEDVLVDGGSVGASASYTFTNVTANHTIAAVFTSTAQATTTSLFASPSPSLCQQTLTITASLLPGMASGSVEFFDGAASLGTATVASGTAVLTLPTGLAVGGHTLSAVYTPSGCYLGSTSPDVAHTVNLASAAVAVTSDVDPSIWAQAVTFTATMSPSTASGTVTFKDSLTTLGTAPLAGGVAQLVASDLNPGNHTAITAVYSGDACHATATSSSFSQVVNRAPTTVSMTSDINPSIWNQAVSLIATVSPAGGNNRVSFFNGNGLIGTAVVNTASGVATLSVSNLMPGPHDVTVTYQGDAHFEPSTAAAPYTQVVNTLLTTVVLTSDVNPSQIGQLVTLTAALSPGDAEGTVMFLDGLTSLGSATVGAGGLATLSTAALAVGTHSLTAIYEGDATHDAATSAPYSQDVNTNPPPQVTVMYPNGTESLNVGDDVTLQWAATDNTAVASVTLSISRNDGATWEAIATDIPNTGSHLWTVTPPGTNAGATHLFTAWFRVTAQDDGGVLGEDASDGAFSLTDPLTAVIVTPLDPETLEGGVRLRWSIPNRTLYTSLELQRSPAEVGPWLAVGVELRDDAGTTVAEDQTTEAGRTYFYRLVGTTSNGTQSVFGMVKGTAGAPREFALSAVWPNPTRGPLTMVFAVSKPAPVRLSVMDLQGREVTVLASGVYRAGRYQVDWDGRTDRGPAPAGLYFVRFVTPDRKLVSRVTIAP